MAKADPEIQALADRLSATKGADDDRDWSECQEFWARPAQKQIEPECIRWPSDYAGGAYLSIACTQTELPASQQRNLVDSWCQVLPDLSEVRWLWFQTKVPQKLFEAACKLHKLESLYISWSAVKELAPLEQLGGLRHLYIGSIVQVEDFGVLERLRHLKWLQLNNLKNMKSLEPIADLAELIGLGITGTESKRLVLPSFQPLSVLKNLEWLHLGAVYAEDQSLRAFDGLQGLKCLEIGNYYPTEEFARLSQFIDSSVCEWLQPFVRSHSSLFPCRKCRKNWRVMCSGKGGRLLCPSCDPLLLAKHVHRFNKALEASKNMR